MKLSVVVVVVFTASPTRSLPQQQQQRRYQSSTRRQRRRKTSPVRVPSTWEEDLVNDLAPPPPFSSSGRARTRSFLPKLLRKEHRGELIDLVRVVRGGSSTSPVRDNAKSLSSKQKNSSWLDNAVQSMVVWLAGVVSIQSMSTAFFHNDNLVDEIANRLLSTESASAVKTIRKIIKQFGDHGVIDVFKEYSAKDVIFAILALGKLQSAAAAYDDQNEREVETVDPKLVPQLARYCAYANAAYGWTMEAAFRGKLHGGNLQALLNKTGIDSADVICADWESRTHRPAYFIAKDVDEKKIVLAIRGTLSARDVLTDLCAAAESIDGNPDGAERAHHGMLEAAKGVAKETEEVVKKHLEENPDYSLVLVGHSLGGGVAAVLGVLWEHEFPDLVVYSFGSPCVGPMASRPTTCDNVISVLGEGDPFSCLSLGHIADLSKGLAILCEDYELRNLILMRTDGGVEAMDRQDLEWCAETMDNLRVQLTGERLYPPGRLLFLKKRDNNGEGEGSNHVVQEVSQSRFRDLRLHPRMLDISRHVPSLYESRLQDIVSESTAA